jgi:hypothetical protein
MARYQPAHACPAFEVACSKAGVVGQRKIHCGFAVKGAQPNDGDMSSSVENIEPIVI